MYTTLGIEDAYKGFLDFLTRFVDNINDSADIFGKLPARAASIIYSIIEGLAIPLNALKDKIENSIREIGEEGAAEAMTAGEKVGKAYQQGVQKGASKSSKIGSVLTTVGSLATLAANAIDTSTEEETKASGITQALGGGAKIVGAAALAYAGQWPAAISAAVSGITDLITACDTYYETATEKAERLSKAAENLNNEAMLAKKDVQNLDTAITELEALEETRYDSAEAAEEYQSKVDELAESFPQLISGFTSSNEAIIKTADAEEELARLRKISAQATYDAAESEIKANEAEIEAKKEAISEQFLQMPIFGKDSEADYIIREMNVQDYLFTMASSAVTEMAQEEYSELRTKYYGNADAYANQEPSDKSLLGRLSSLREKWNSFTLDTPIEEYAEFIKDVETLADEDVLKNDEGGGLLGLDPWISEAQTYIEEIFTLESELGDLYNEGSAKRLQDLNAVISEAAQEYSKANDKSSFFDESSYLSSVIGTNFNDMYESAEEGVYENWEAFKASKENEINTIVEETQDFWSSLSEEEQDLLDTMLSDTSTYSDQAIFDTFKDLNPNSKLGQTISENYSKQTSEISDRLRSNENEIFNRANISNNILTEDTETLLNTGDDLIKVYREKGLNTAADDLLNAYVKLITAEDTLSEDDAAKANELAQALTKAELDSWTGIDSIIKQLEEQNDEGTYNTVIEALQDMREALVVNVTTEIAAIRDSISSFYENNADTMEKAIEGLSVDEALSTYESMKSAMGDELGSFADVFTASSTEVGKYVLSDSKIIAAYYDAQVGNLKKNNEELQKIVNNASMFTTWEGARAAYLSKDANFFQAVDQLGLNSQLEKAAQSSNSEEAWSEFFELYQQTAEDENIEISINDNLIAQMEDYGEIYANILAGNYQEATDLLNQKFVEEDRLGRDLTLKKILAKDYNIEAYTSEELAEMQAIVDSFQPVISSFLSSAVSDGVEYAKSALSEQEKEQMKDAGFDLSTLTDENLGDYIAEYGKAANMTISQINEKYASWLENQSNSFSKIAEGAEFVSSSEGIFSLEQIQSMADKAQKTLDVFMEEHSISYVEDLDAYVVNNLSGLDIDNSVVEDGIQTFFQNINDALSNALEGTLTNEEFDSLNERYKQLTGQELDKSGFTETAGGLKLSTKYAKEIWYDFDQINHMQGSALLDQLVEVAEDSGEYDNIYEVMQRIADLNKQLEEAEVGSKREKQLKAELAITEKIKSNLLAANDSLNFMDQDLSASINQPLSLLEGGAEALDVLSGSDFSNGYVSYQDWNNIVSFIKSQGQEVLDAAGLSSDQLLTASELLKQGYASFEAVDGEVLLKIGDNFKINADGMEVGVSEGIKSLAKSMVEMLDQQINMLDTLAEMENVYDEFSVDGSLDISKVFDEDGSLTTEGEELNTGIRQALVEAGATEEMLAQYDELLTNNHEAYIQLIDKLMKLDWTGDYNTNLQLLQDVFAEFGMTFEVGEVQYTVNGKPYSTYEEAVKAANEANMDTSEIQCEPVKVDQPIETELTQKWRVTNSNGIDETFDTKERAESFIKTMHLTGGVTLEPVTATQEVNIVYKTVSSGLAALKNGIKSGISKITNKVTSKNTESATDSDTTSSSQEQTIKVDADTSPAEEKIEELKKNVEDITASISFEYDSTSFNAVLKAIKELTEAKSVKITFTSIISGALSSLFTKLKKLGVFAKGNVSSATGNVALSKGNAAAIGRKTLVGELGSELIVSNGHYYIAGLDGPEFVNLADDAIVFNHIQTDALLKNGKIKTRGRPVTNERIAAGMAKGNAKASASEAAAALREIRDTWAALLTMTASDLGKKAGSGSGGGSGGGGGGGSSSSTKAYIDDLERWYNLLRKIEHLEEEITYQQAKRENLVSGTAYSQSLRKELEMLKKQKTYYEDLAELQYQYYENRRKELASSAYSKIFTYDENGLMQYTSGTGNGLDLLATLNQTNAYGASVWTDSSNALVKKYGSGATGQLAYLAAMGFNTSALNYQADGTENTTAEDKLQTFFDTVDSIKDELDELYDSYHEEMTNIEKNQTAQNEILQEYTDNQKSLEDSLLTAIEDMKQAEIDKMQDQLDAYKDASAEYINGLNEALDKEREMYNKQNSLGEITKLQRKLAILKRAGGSESEIVSLQDQLDSQLQDAYFDAAEEQISALQEAADNQEELLQKQIDIQTEALEYQKENGLLWSSVYDMMNNWSLDKIQDFVVANTEDYKSASALAVQEGMKEVTKQIEIWLDFYWGTDAENNANQFLESVFGSSQTWAEVEEMLGSGTTESTQSKAKEAYVAAYTANAGDDITEEERKSLAEAAARSVINSTLAESEEVAAQKSSVSYQFQTKAAELGLDSNSIAKGLEYVNSGQTVDQALETLKTDLLTDLQNYKGTKKLVTNSNRYKDINFKTRIAGIAAPRNLTVLGFAGFNSGGGPVLAIKYGGYTQYMPAARFDGFANGGEMWTKAMQYRKLLLGYSTGGMDYTTGPAMLHGTASKPEAVLNADDTKLFREQLFGNGDYSLRKTIESIQQLQSQLSDTTANASVEFNGVNITIESGTIASDYDARRAGQMVMDEMFKIAKRNGSTSVQRR